ncbi:hypothetical protein ACWGIN_27305 [Streptomyces sp. NPDC054861]
MAIEDLEPWRRELQSSCDIVQYEDDTVSAEEAGRRYHRYVELADMVEGTEGPQAVTALVGSLRAEEDYGAHQAVYGALERFPSLDRARGVASAAAELLNLPMDSSGQVLQLTAVLSSEEALAEFSTALGELEPEVWQAMTTLIAQHENDEWLADERAHGRLRAGEADRAHPHPR